MSRPKRSNTRRPEGERRSVAPATRGRLPLGSGIAIAAVAAFAVALTAVALAAAVPTLGSANNAKLGRVVAVDSHGRTVYVLRPETSRHLLCTSRTCLRFWPPVTVHSRHTRLRAGRGVHGKLGILRRRGGSLQVTLNGLPLYRFRLDTVRGQANGEGIRSFGGTWHVVTLARLHPAPPKPMPSAQMPAPSGPMPAPTGY